MNDNLINSLEYTVSELSTSIKRIIEDNFDYIRLKAEVGRVSKPKSGHIYLDLKDDTSVISGIIWKGSVNKLNILPEEGLEVVCTGKVTTYAGQSKYQIIIENIEPYGVGALMALLEKRKEKLLKENLFDDNFKKQIPFLPKRIGVITSPTGAVIRDILHRIEDRFPVNITVWPVKVQGDSSPEEIIDAIEGFHLLDQSNLEKPDVIIIARGGGSVEDLWGFNDEALVRKVFDSKIPIISAIGHETDTTLIDLVADLRAPTPTAAAEMAVPVRKILITSVEDSYERIKNYINNKIEFEERSLLLLDKAIPKIEVMLKNYNLRYKKASSILNISLVSMIKHYQDIFLRKTVSFKANMLTKNFNFTKDDFLEVSKSLINSTVNIFDKKTNLLQLQSGLLDVLSHNSVLKRGFAIVKDKKSKIITSSKKIKEDEELIINFYKNDKIKVSLKRDK